MHDYQSVRVTILWDHPSGYLKACIDELIRKNCIVLLICRKPNHDAPFKTEHFQATHNNFLIEFLDEDIRSSRAVASKVMKFNPNILLCSGWRNLSYLMTINKIADSVMKVLCFDTSWKGSLKQQLGRIYVRLALSRLFDFVFIPGERQYQTAIKFGFDQSRIVRGLYAPDDRLFEYRRDVSNSVAPFFLFVGRLVSEKGFKDLIAAYKIYRQDGGKWDLNVAGVGPLECTARNIDGVHLLGFVQPPELSKLMSQAACLVAPSTYEPWGMQISEASLMGLPIIASTECGSGVHLIQDGFNGYLVPPNSPHYLFLAMKKMDVGGEMTYFSSNSLLLSRQFRPSIFAKNLLDAFWHRFSVEQG